MSDLSKEAQVSRSPGGNRRCTSTGTLKRDCRCDSCRAWRNQRTGAKGQRKTRQVVGVNPERFSGRIANEETWHASNLRFEVKSGKQAEPINTRYVEARNQSDASRAIGDMRPFVFVAAPDGTTPLLVVRADEMGDVVAAFIEEWSTAGVREGEQ